MTAKYAPLLLRAAVLNIAITVKRADGRREVELLQGLGDSMMTGGFKSDLANMVCTGGSVDIPKSIYVLT
ncbi:hypothetical protein Bpfe_024110 [Biomphalaria pfeifferi]|uniref:Uncharacterized protein n=1 Tax=Biomphalaria pfeifferi TaxID=112525 RepID=A0AAD8B2T5_BIOPF|nr:hypothetical protein Bpfe_024110 [Biomphalaria pfeifferi]